MTTTIEQIFERLDVLNAEVSIFRHPASYMKAERWTITIEVEADRAKVIVRHSGNDVGEVIATAMAKLERTVERGLPIAALAAPIEAKAMLDRAEIDDEVP